MSEPEILERDPSYGEAHLGIARIKRPHRCFLPGDLVIGIRMDGCADNLLCWGWSSKFNRVVGGRHGYRIYYAGWEWMPRRVLRAYDNCKLPRPRETLLLNGRGYLFIVKWFDGVSLNFEYPHYLRNEAWIRRLLTELSCGNMPLTRREAAATPSTLFAAEHRFPKPFRGRIIYGK